MNTCPHCGAPLGDNARFCTQCMTPLNQKRVVPTPKYFPVRWLSAAAAVLVLCGAVWSGFQRWPQEEQAAIAPPTTSGTTSDTSSTQTTTTTTEAPTTTTLTTAVSTTTLTTLAEAFSTSMESTTTTTTKKSTTYPTYATIPTAPTTAPYSTTARTTTASTTAPTTTTTTTKTTTTTAPTPTYPASWDEPTVYYTGDGEMYEDVGWTYRAAKSTFEVSDRLIYTASVRYNIPFSECIVVTGFTKPATNGCYRIPPAIDGKVVVGVDMQTPVAGALQFNDAEVAPTVRVITFPPEVLVVYPYTFDQCSNIRDAYFGSAVLMLYPEAMPTNTDVGYTDGLGIYGGYNIRMLYDPSPKNYSLKEYCEFVVASQSPYEGEEHLFGCEKGKYVRYKGVYYWTYMTWRNFLDPYPV